MRDSCLGLLLLGLALEEIFDSFLEMWFIGHNLDILVVLGAEIGDDGDHAVYGLVVVHKDVFSLGRSCIF